MCACLLIFSPASVLAHVLPRSAQTLVSNEVSSSREEISSHVTSRARRHRLCMGTFLFFFFFVSTMVVILFHLFLV